MLNCLQFELHGCILEHAILIFSLLIGAIALIFLACRIYLKRRQARSFRGIGWVGNLDEMRDSGDVDMPFVEALKTMPPGGEDSDFERRQ